MNRNRGIAAAVVLAALLIGGVYLFRSGRPAGTAAPGTDWKTYSSLKLGLSFNYQAYYYLEEKALGSGERRHYALILTEDTDENRRVRQGLEEGREGPPAISIDAYQNDLDGYGAEIWIKNTNFSDFKLSDGNLAPVMIGGESGLAYRSTGLYETDNSVVARPGYVYRFAAGWLTAEDRIRSDFQELLQSVRFSEPVK